jgi:hypothetical protein
MVPLPPLVMITSAPHFVHMYRFPTVFAIVHLLGDGLKLDLLEIG